MVSGGATPKAFSTSIFVAHHQYRSKNKLNCGEDEWRTSEAVQTELIYFTQSCGVLKIVLNDIDVIGGGEKTRESRGFRVP